MMSRCLAFAAASAVAIHLSGCDREKAAPEPQPTATTVVVVPPPVPSPSPSEAPTPVASASPSTAALDFAALEGKRDPARLLRFYAEAIAARNWTAAARAWGKGSGVTASTLKAAYDRSQRPVLEIGKGEQDAGAGSLFYEAPVVLRFGPGDAPQRGSLFLRRVNDVDGATREQLRWHIERSTIGAGS